MNTPNPEPPEPAEKTCPKCGRPILEGSPRGLCPLCLISEVARDDSPPADAPAPEVDELRGAFPTLELIEPLGAGGMGRVYKARQPHLDRFVALKLLPPGLADDPAWVERFTREARALARLNHPGVVQVFDFGEATSKTADGQEKKFPFLLMEYVDGVNLRQALRSGSLTASEALSIVPPICAALQYAHEQGVLHRDIKPENILLDTEGRVKIADFGLAKLGGTKESPGATLTATGHQLGTAAYMAPEQIERPHEVDHRADIYSLGVVFYELLTGELPLGRFPAPSEKAGTDPRLDTIVFRTLEKERDRRFQTAGEMKTEVETVANTAAGEAPKPGEWQVRCTTCGYTRSLASYGGTRIGAASIGKRTLIKCPKCGGLRFAAIEQAGTAPPRPPVKPEAATGIPPRSVVGLVLSLLVLPFLLIGIGLAAPIVLHGSPGAMVMRLAVFAVLLLGAALTVVGFTWLFRRLRRSGFSTGTAALIVALGLILLPPAGCVALMIPSYAMARTSERHQPASRQYQLHRDSTSLRGNEISAHWVVRADMPLWLTLEFRDRARTIQLRRTQDGRYFAEIQARILRDVSAGHSRIDLTLGNGLETVGADSTMLFENPRGEWFNRLFAEAAPDRAYQPGQSTIMWIGDVPLVLNVEVSPKKEVKHVAQFEVKNIDLTKGNDGYQLALDFTELDEGDAEIFFRTQHLGEPLTGENIESSSELPELRKRRIWTLPAGLEEAKVQAIRDKLQSDYIGKPMSIWPGQEWMIFQAQLADGNHAEVSICARHHNASSR